MENSSSPAIRRDVHGILLDPSGIPCILPPESAASTYRKSNRINTNHADRARHRTLLLRPLNHNTNFSTHTAECTLGFCGQTVSSLFQDASGACA